MPNTGRSKLFMRHAKKSIMSIDASVWNDTSHYSNN